MSLVVDIEKHYSTFDLKVAFEAAHETLGFLGASGCGKSLTLRCIAGVETPDAGKIVVNGKTYFDKAPGKKASVNLSAQQRKSALLFQNYQLFPNLTVKANIAAGIPREVLKRDGDVLIERQLLSLIHIFRLLQLMRPKLRWPSRTYDVKRPEAYQT